MKKHWKKPKSFCPNCGWGVKVDEDELCAGCGCTACGPEVDRLFDFLETIGLMYFEEKKPPAEKEG
jgi:hypothetical protein